MVTTKVGDFNNANTRITVSTNYNSAESTVGTLLVFQRHGRQLHTYIVEGWYGDVGGVGAENGLCEALAWRVLIGRQDICGSLWMKLVTHGLVPIRCGILCNLWDLLKCGGLQHLYVAQYQPFCILKIKNKK